VSAGATYIQIIDRGYLAKGKTGAMAYSGTICSLDEPFTINGQSQLDYLMIFTPSSESAGTVDYSAYGHGLSARGTGPYTIEGRDSKNPKINVPSTTVTGTFAGHSLTTQTISASFDLVPIEAGDCVPTRPPPGAPPELRGKGPF
jgi:hypothetical protein